MCEVSERIFKEGRAEGRVEGRVEGRMEQAKSTAFHLADMGLAADKIAGAVEVRVGMVKQWLDDRASALQ